MKAINKRLLSVALGIFLAFALVFTAPVLARAEEADAEYTPTNGVITEEEIYDGEDVLNKDDVEETVSYVKLIMDNFYIGLDEASEGDTYATHIRIEGADVSSFSFTVYMPSFVSVEALELSPELSDGLFETNISEDASRFSVGYSSAGNKGGIAILTVYFHLNTVEEVSGYAYFSDYMFTNTSVAEIYVDASGADFIIRDGVLMGDADMNGAVELADIMAMLRSIVDPNYTLSEMGFTAADIDKNGAVNIYDCQYVQNYLAGNLGSLDDVTSSQPGTEGSVEKIPIAEAIAIGESLENGAETDCEYILSGTVVGIENETYGNTYLTDGKYQIWLYGLCDEMGNKYADMSIKPKAGDEIGVRGKITKYYNETTGEVKVEIINAVVTWVKSTVEECDHRYSGTVVDGGNCQNPSTIEYVCTLCGDAYSELGDYGNHTFVNGTCEHCGANIGEVTEEISLLDAINIAKDLQVTMISDESYIVSGTVADILDEKTGRMRITDESGASLLVYSFLNGNAGTVGVGQSVTLSGRACKYTVGNNVVLEMVDAEHVEINDGAEVLTVEAFNAIAGELKGGSASTEAVYAITGRIIKITDAVRGNMWIADDCGNEFYVYGLCVNYDGNVIYYGEFSEKPRVGDIIAIEGNITKYFGSSYQYTTEMKDATLTDVTPADSITVNDANNIGSGISVSVEGDTYYVVTGTIDRIEDTRYGKMYLVDENGNELYIYGFIDPATVSDLAPGAVITVRGIAAKYMSSDGEVVVEMKNAELTEVSEGTETTTVESFNAAASNLQGSGHDSTWYEITATVKEEPQATFGNLYLVDGEGNEIYVYGLYDEGRVRYDSLAEKPKAGDVITVRGCVSRYLKRDNTNQVQIQNAVLIGIGQDVIEDEEKSEAPMPEAPTESTPSTETGENTAAGNGAGADAGASAGASSDATGESTEG